MTSRSCVWAASIAIGAAAALISPATAAAMPSCGSVATDLSAGPVTQVAGYVDQYQFPLTLTNISGESCTAQGRLDVVLVGPDDPMWGPAFQLRQPFDDP